MSLPNFSGPSSGPASGLVVHTPALLMSLSIDYKVSPSQGTSFSVEKDVSMVSRALHVDISLCLGNVVDGALDAIFGCYIQDKRDDLTSLRAQLLRGSMDTGARFKHLQSPAGDVNLCSINGQSLCVHCSTRFVSRLVRGQWACNVGIRLKGESYSNQCRCLRRLLLD